MGHPLINQQPGLQAWLFLFKPILTKPMKQTTAQTYNDEVYRTYFKLLKHTEQLIASLEQHELRCTLQLVDRSPISAFSKVHELVNPVLYLSLQCMDGERLSIHFGFEQSDENYHYSHITAKFLRILYKLTSANSTSVNIEDCISTEYVIVNCSELYECLEDANYKHHTFKLIRHRRAGKQTKQVLAVA